MNLNDQTLVKQFSENPCIYYNVYYLLVKVFSSKANPSIQSSGAF